MQLTDVPAEAPVEVPAAGSRQNQDFSTALGVLLIVLFIIFLTTRRSFPSNVTAKMFGFKEYKYFEAPPEAQKLPKVDFSR